MPFGGEDFAPVFSDLQGHRVVGVRRVHLTCVAPLEEVPEGAQAGVHVFQNRYPVGAQAGSAALSWIALVTPQTTANGLSVEAQARSAAQAVAPLGTLAVQVDDVGERPGASVFGQVPGTIQEDVVGIVVRAPGVSGLTAGRPGSSRAATPCRVSFEGWARGTSRSGRGVDQVRPLAAGVEDGGEPAGAARRSAASSSTRSAISLSVPTRATS